MVIFRKKKTWAALRGLTWPRFLVGSFKNTRQASAWPRLCMLKSAGFFYAREER